MGHNITFTGRVSRQPELRYVGNNTPVLELSVADNIRTPDGNGGYKDEPVFIEVTIWGRRAVYAANNADKGRIVWIAARFQNHSWMDEGGGKRTRLRIICNDIQCLGPKIKKDDSSSPNFTSQPPPQQPTPAPVSVTDPLYQLYESNTGLADEVQSQGEDLPFGV